MSSVFPLESHAMNFSWLSLHQLKIMAWDPRGRKCFEFHEKYFFPLDPMLWLYVGDIFHQLKIIAWDPRGVFFLELYAMDFS
jgi:hypothetical protein